MSDDRVELPLFEPPQGESKEDLNALFDDPPPGRAGADEPVVVEAIEVPENPETTPEAFSEAPTEDLYSFVPLPAGIGARLAAGLIDLLVHVALAGLLIGGSSLLEAPIGWRHAMPLTFVAAIFSFVYHVVPLAFWGRTPGMALAGLRARTLDDEPLSLPQATKRWLALLLTAATCGLGVMLALGGRSLADRLSGSQTLQQ